MTTTTKFLVVVLILLLIILQYKLWFEKGSVIDNSRLKQTIAMEQQKNDELKQRNQKLAIEVDDLKSGHATIEQQARKELGMVNKGEKFYQIVDDDKSENK